MFDQNTKTHMQTHKYKYANTYAQIQASDIINTYLPPKHRDLYRMYIMFDDEDDGLLTHVSSIENHRLLN